MLSKGRRGQGALVGVIVGLAVAAVILFSFAVPTIKSAIAVTANLSTAELAIAGLVTLSLILAIVMSALRAAGIM